jgi:CRISPR/Cas system CSM-associated protein Csm3 (group 7 of RAMP superfamily)
MAASSMKMVLARRRDRMTMWGLPVVPGSGLGGLARANTHATSFKLAGAFEENGVGRRHAGNMPDSGAFGNLPAGCGAGKVIARLA